VDGTGQEVTRWFLESAVIVPNVGGVPRLSGKAMRDHLYFATAPGNMRLHMAVKKKWNYDTAPSCVAQKVYFH
jgi:hypothetical protein